MGVRAILWLLAAACAPLCAQSWDSLQSVRGRQVKVLETGGQEHKGTCEAVTSDGITVLGGKNRLTIERSKVKRVSVRSGARRVRNIAIGAAVGLAAGLITDQTLGTFLRNEGHDSERAITYAAPIIVFGGIGAAFSGYHTVYRVR